MFRSKLWLVIVWTGIALGALSTTGCLSRRSDGGLHLHRPGWIVPNR